MPLRVDWQAFCPYNSIAKEGEKYIKEGALISWNKDKGFVIPKL
jgi:hypothetical protein